MYLVQWTKRRELSFQGSYCFYLHNLITKIQNENLNTTIGIYEE